MADQEQAYRAQAVEVGVTGVEAELAKQWRSAAEGPGPGGANAVTRVILSNLLVYSSTEHEAEEAMNVISDVIAAHPSRAVVVDDEPDHRLRTDRAEVSMVCSIGERGRQLCGEVVRIHSQSSSEVVFGTIMPVMVPDIPTILWIPSDLAWSRDFLKKMLQVSDQWVIDSRRFADWSDGFGLVESLVREDLPSIAVHDLPWISIISWRDAIARMFDQQPARDYLLGVNSVRIRCRLTDNHLPDITSVLITTWLTCALGWKMMGVSRIDEGWRVGVTCDSREAAIIIETVKDSRHPLESVVIESQRNDRRATFKAELTEQADAVRISIHAPDVTSVPYAARMITSSLRDEINTVLSGPTSDAVYKQMLHVITRLASDIEVLKGEHP